MTADEYMEKAARALSSARLLFADNAGDKIDHEKANWAVDQSAAFIVVIALGIELGQVLLPSKHLTPPTGFCSGRRAWH